MKMHRLASVVVLLLAGAAQAVNTVAPLTNKGEEQAQPDLVGGVGPLVEGQPVVVPSLPDSVLVPTQDILPDFSALRSGDPADPLAQGAEGMEGPPSHGLIGGVNRDAEWATGHHWSTDPKKFSDAGFVNAGNREELAAFDDVYWVTAPLPTVRKTSIMEIIVFPAFAVGMVILAVAVLVGRLRRRKPPECVQHLLQV